MRHSASFPSKHSLPRHVFPKSRAGGRFPLWPCSHPVRGTTAKDIRSRGRIPASEGRARAPRRRRPRPSIHPGDPMPRVPAGVLTPARISALAALGAMALAAACSDSQPTAVATLDPRTATPGHSLAAFDCVATPAARTVTCSPSAALAGGARGAIIGGQNGNVKLTSSNVSYDSQSEIFQFDVTVQNLMNEAIGTPDGTVADPEGVQVFFESGPTTTSGSGTITVANADGFETFTKTNQPFFAYHEILAKDAVSQAKTWQLQMPQTVGTFAFQLFVETDVQYLLVINELMVNPGNYVANPDLSGEWVEIYNAGSRPVDLQGLVFADSAASGRRPYNRFNDTTRSLVVQPGAYFVLGETTNTTSNGGVPVDYSYGGGMAFANSLDAFKIARVYGTDTLTLDRTQYASAATSAKDGISRELKNPALDNSNMDGSNWGDASVTSVYGPGGRGTPKAQNSTFTPNLMVTDPFSSTGEDPVKKSRR